MRTRSERTGRDGPPAGRRGPRWFASRRAVIGVGVCLILGAAATGLARPGTARGPHVFGNPHIWHWAPTRTYHVENYRLRLHFNQARGEIFGDELVTLRPFEAGFRRFYLNSTGLTIQSVSLDSRDGSSVLPLTFTRKDPRLWITLNHEYGPDQTLKIRIVYHGVPREGLYFLNPTVNYPDWPHEIWSQGEPETNHDWFPCWDYPNDMATSETITTVPVGQSVVSNGRLVSVTHAHGQATYDWVESVPHSSYLTSIAIGPWRKVSEQYHGIPVDYYAPRSVSRARVLRSFHLTPDMIGFFSRATGVPYPYEQYAQVVVHNYLYGGMENVSATTLTDWTLHDARAEMDYPSTGLVSHELGQHWFGDFVQGHDWADIWLNEGFATYLQALYTQYHEGNDAFRFEIYHDQQAEQAQQRARYLRPIVDRHYTDPMQMFDAITHEKGAAVLDMLRYVMDGPAADARPASQQEPFFQALHAYLVAHRTGTADTADVIEALRQTTGKELGWFFREWVFMAGHPEYHVTAVWNAARKVEHVTVRQTQKVDAATPVFEMPIELAFYGPHGAHRRTEIRDEAARQAFDVPLTFRPQWVDFDPDDFIDKTVVFPQPVGALIAEAEKDPSMMSRLWAVQQLGAAPGPDRHRSVAALAHVLASDTFYGVRSAAAASLGRLGGPDVAAILLKALHQPDSRVRTAVVTALGPVANRPSVYRALVATLHEDVSYAAEAAAAEDLGHSGVAAAFDLLRAEAAGNPEVHVMQAVLAGLAATRKPQAAAVLIAAARPGRPERVRLAALGALATMRGLVPAGERRGLQAVTAGAVHDPFAPVRQAGARLARALGRRMARPLQ